MEVILITSDFVLYRIKCTIVYTLEVTAEWLQRWGSKQQQKNRFFFFNMKATSNIFSHFRNVKSLRTADMLVVCGLID